MTDPMQPFDIGGKSSTTETTDDEGKRTRTTTTEWTVGTADVALFCVTLLCVVLFVLSLAVESWRNAVGGGLPVLLGVFTLAVGGTSAYRVLLKRS